ncbi:MAG: hypothetical protein II131_00425 [Neisseriaceae bacterium]|nr:hypothetical protein [Neisseriaceae bacterium]
MNKPSIFFPLVLIIVGALWFLRATDILPPSYIILAIALCVAGVLVLILDGINKQSIVAGPLLIYCGVAVYLFYRDLLNLSPLIALGMVVSGVLMLLARSDVIPNKINPPAKNSQL